MALALVLALLPLSAGGDPARGTAGQNGEAPLVRSVEVEGNRRNSEAEIVSAFGQAPGEQLIDEPAREHGMQVLLQFYGVRVTHVLQRPAGEGEIDLLIRVEELPLDLEPRFVGNVEIDREELLEWAGLGEETELFLYQAGRVRSRILHGYRQEGFYFADVDVVERPGRVDPETGEESPSDIIFNIVEGPKVRVRGVEIHGNRFFPDSRFLFFKRGLSRLAQTELRGPILLSLFSKSFVPEILDADVIAIREVYRDQGFLDALVKVDRLEFSDARDWVTIHIVVDEGARYRVGTVSIESIEVSTDPEDPERVLERPEELAFPLEELLELFELRPGAFYEVKSLRADERTLRTHYGKRGYIDHPSLPLGQRWQFHEPLLVYDPQEAVVDVTYRISQGDRQFIREIRIRGNQHTQDRVVRRLITSEPGDVADPAEIERSRSRIQSTGFFSDPRNVLEHREPIYRFVETGDPSWKDLEYIVEEGQDLSFNISGGVSTNTGAFGTIAMSKRNFDITNLPSSPLSIISDITSRRAFTGAGQELRIRASPGTRISFFDVYFSEPDLLGRHRDRVSLSLNAQQRLRLFESHEEERDRYGFRVGRQIGIDGSIAAGYSVGRVEISDIDSGGEPTIGSPLTVPRLLKEQEGDHDLGYLELDYRLRTIDDRISPRNGVEVSLQNEFYDGVLGSDFNFVKSQLFFDFFDELDETRPGYSHRYHIRLAGGVAAPYGGTDDVPYSERFFLGGQTTLRGFDYRGVGPNELSFPVGGETYLYGTLEYKRPLFTQTQPGTYRVVETINWGLFVDAGVLDPDAFSLDVSEYRASAGVLFGLSVPLPITFAFGFPLRKGNGDDTRILSFGILF